MKRLSFLWLLLFATCFVSFANTYSDDNNTDLWSDWEDIRNVYWYVYYTDSIYYGFYKNSYFPDGSNPEETASVAYYFVGSYGSTPAVYPKSKKLSEDMRMERKYMPHGEMTMQRRLYTVQDIRIRSSITVENKTIPVTRVFDCAFAESPNLTSISLPSSITVIGKGAFRNCKKLSSIVIPNSVDNVEENAFQDCSGLQTVTLGSNVKYIGERAFGHCTSLTSIAIPNSVDSIQGYTFSGCTNLTSATIGSGVKYIDEYAFNGTGLISITIPDNVKSIGNSAFGNCNDLTTITCTSTIPPTINYSFSNCSNLKAVYIPCGTKEAYEAAGWRNLPLTEPAPDGVVSVETADNVKGQVKIEDQSTCRNNSTAIISATSQYGYHFMKWNDGNTDNPRTVKVTKDITYTAYFGV